MKSYDTLKFYIIYFQNINIYIYYKKNSKYEHVLIDLYNNYDVIKHKKILFNKININ